MPKDPNSPDFKAGEGIHLVAEVSKGNPYLNEPITVVYKLYFDPRFTVQNVREVENPKYNGFWSQHIDIAKLEGKVISYKGMLIEWCQKHKYPFNFEFFEEKMEYFKIRLALSVIENEG